MNKCILLFLLLFVPFISAIDQPIPLICGGDSELLITCLGDDEITFLGFDVPSEGIGGAGGGPYITPTEIEYEEEEIIKPKVSSLFSIASFFGIQKKEIMLFISMIIILFILILLIVLKDRKKKKEKKKKESKEKF